MGEFSGLTVFDLDHTLLKGNSSYHFGSFLYKNKFFSRLTLYSCLFYYVRHKYFGLSLEKVHQKIFDQLFKNCSRVVIEQYVRMFLKQHLKKLLSHSVIKRLHEARHKGCYTIILSSAPDFLAVPIAKQLGVHACKSTVYEVDDKERFNQISQVFDGDHKAQYVLELAQRLGLDKSVVTVYSDSILDLPVLKIAGKAVGVKPDDSLRKVCEKNGWEIL